MYNFASTFRKKQPDLAIDLGTANIRAVLRGEGVVFDEPSLCWFDNANGRSHFLGAGRSVSGMVDRVTGTMEIRRPLARGVLQDIDAASALLSYSLTSLFGKAGSARPKAMIGLPADATKAEASALLSAADDAGFGKVDLVREPFAAALGAGLSVHDACASMIIECGAGTTEIAVYSLGGLCLSRSIRQGGLALDAALADYLHVNHHFRIGQQTSEKLKRQLTADLTHTVSADGMITINGSDAAKRRPGSIMLPVAELRPVLDKHFAPLIGAAREVLAEISPSLAADLMSDEIVMTGGGACAGYFASRLADQTGMVVSVASDEAMCVAKGLEELLDG